MIKTETQIAQKYIDELKDMKGSSLIVTSITRTQIKEHKSSCQRFLDKYKEKIIASQFRAGSSLYQELLNEIKDREEALKVYEKNGI